MNAGEILDTALGKFAEFNVAMPSTTSAAYGRMTRRQEQLFAKGAVLNREFFGADEALAVVANEVDTQDLNPLPMRIHVVRVEAPGTSTWAQGTQVAVVHVDDLEAELPPRATLRDGVLEGVGTDWDGLTSIRIFHSKRPAELTVKTDIPQLPKQFHELLALDIAKWLMRKAMGLTDGARKQYIDLLTQEELELENDYERFLKDWAFAETHRFGSSADQG